jgi:hypothetical protein
VFYRIIWNIVGKYSILCCDNIFNAVTTTASSSTSITKEDVAAIIVVENIKLKTEIRGEMSSLKEVIITEARRYTKKVNEGLRTAFIQQMAKAQKNLNKH